MPTNTLTLLSTGGDLNFFHLENELVSVSLLAEKGRKEEPVLTNVKILAVITELWIYIYNKC